MAQAEEDDERPTLLMAQTCALVHTGGVTPEDVFLNEEKVIPRKVGEGVWYLDTGASSHMTGSRAAFTSLNESVHGMVKFGDGSFVNINGLGSILFKCFNSKHRVLIGVYYIPDLKSNIVSLGQLDEDGCRILIENGDMVIHDRERKLLARVARAKNRLYILSRNLAAPVCLLTKMDEAAWVWHARYRHLHFRALREFSWKQMVRDIPHIDHVEQICDGNALGK